MGFRPVAIDNANEKGWAALLNILLRLQSLLSPRRYKIISWTWSIFFPTLYVLMNALGL